MTAGWLEDAEACAEAIETRLVARMEVTRYKGGFDRDSAEILRPIRDGRVALGKLRAILDLCDAKTARAPVYSAVEAARIHQRREFAAAVRALIESGEPE